MKIYELAHRFAVDGVRPGLLAGVHRLLVVEGDEAEAAGPALAAGLPLVLKFSRNRAVSNPKFLRALI